MVSRIFFNKNRGVKLMEKGFQRFFLITLSLSYFMRDFLGSKQNTQRPPSKGGKKALRATLLTLVSFAVVKSFKDYTLACCFRGRGGVLADLALQGVLKRCRRFWGVSLFCCLRRLPEPALAIPE